MRSLALVALFLLLFLLLPFGGWVLRVCMYVLLSFPSPLLFLLVQLG